MHAMPTMGQPGCAEDQAAAELCFNNFTSFRFASNDVFNLLTRQDIVKSVRNVFFSPQGQNLILEQLFIMLPSTCGFGDLQV